MNSFWMKKVFVCLFIASVVLFVFNTLCHALASNALVDSGIDYTEVVETIQNPGAGYTTTFWCNSKPGDTPVSTASGSLVLYFVDIGAFSSGVNGYSLDNGTYVPGEDIPLDDHFFSQWKKTLDNARKSGSMVAVRFRYDAVGKDDPEPATFQGVLSHVQQIIDSHIFDDYKDIFALVESGFVGKWGEQHGGKYTDVAFKAQLLDVLLNAVPESIAVTVRTPDTFAHWAGVKRSQLNNSEVFENARTSTNPEERRVLLRRVGIYNDGYMGSDSDLGTFSNRRIETNWIGHVTPETYYGGEFSGNINFAQTFDTYLPENAIPEMYKTHLSYINGNIFPLYKNFTFDRVNDTVPADNSAYYGQNAFTFIRDHIGYRFVLRKSELTNKLKQGDILKLKFRVENTGFSAPVPHTKGYIMLEKDDVYIKAPINLDTHYWNSCATVETELNVKIPDNIKTGSWNVYLKEIMGGYHDELSELALRSIRFANDGVWNGVLGANYLGTVEIGRSETHGCDNSLYEIKSSAISSDEFLDSGVKPVVDGMMSFGSEWTDNTLLAQENGISLHMRSDEKYVYVMSRLPNTAKNPVYNVKLCLHGASKDNWIYYGVSTSPYYDHGNYAGVECKWKNGMVEFRIPFTWLGIKPTETQFDKLRVFLQDSSIPGWGNLGDIEVTNFNISSDLNVYTVEKDMVLKATGYYVLRVRTPVENVSYQWLKDGVPLKNGSSDTYIIDSASSANKGKYSVILTSEEGLTKEVQIAYVKDVIIVDFSSAFTLLTNNLLPLTILIFMILTNYN